jgi:hypothetical protein
VIKRVLVGATVTLSLTLGAALPVAASSSNSSRLAQCERAAAERFARRAQTGDRVKARRQFDNDIVRCKRRFG